MILQDHLHDKIQKDIDLELPVCLLVIIGLTGGRFLQDNDIKPMLVNPHLKQAALPSDIKALGVDGR